MKIEIPKLISGTMEGLSVPSSGTLPDSENNRLVVQGNSFKISNKGNWINLPDGGLDLKRDPLNTITAGGYHNIAIKSDGTLVGWGLNNKGQCDIPEGLADIVAVSAGSSHSLALRSNGKVIAWGDSSSGQTAVPKNLRKVVQIACGNSTSFALTENGEVISWGRNNYGQLDLPEPEGTIAKIAAGNYHSVWLYADGSLNVNVNSHPNSAIGPALRKKPNGTFVDVVAASDYCLAIRNDNRIIGWGYSYYNADSPFVRNATGVAAGSNFGVATDTSDTVIHWGWDGNGNGLKNPPTLDSPPIQIAAGIRHALIVCADGTVAAWGSNDNGQCDVPPNLNLN